MKKFPLILFTIILITACQSSDKQTAETNDSDHLRVISWGGQYQDSQEVAIFDAFKQQYPSEMINIINKADGAFQKLRNRRYTRASEWDVVDMVAADAVKACNEDLLVKLDAQDTIFGDDLLDQIKTVTGLECAIPNIAFSTTFAYRTDAWGGRKPKTISDFFNLNRFPGKRSLQKTAQNNLVWALLADGVSIDKVYGLLETEDGLNQAFRKLNTIKKHILWWEEGKLPTNWLASEKVVLPLPLMQGYFRPLLLIRIQSNFFGIGRHWI